MSVASRNPFALLEDNESSRPSSPTPATKSKTDAPAAAPAKTNQRSRGPASRGGRYYQRGGKAAAPKDSEGADAAEETPGDGPRKRCSSFLPSSISCDPDHLSPTPCPHI
ncbi:hypothetical protein NLI96_g11690 [Meripilus lineatus]|uniref:Uncharacterized protein n=1 Tax=Meripilus lineatus TaxID=2056292 RepID=A0AAD5Y8X0_9APHY|nr:hypothetical protein NLI96_g11690 [Physisporinus lineatus]